MHTPSEAAQRLLLSEDLRRAGIGGVNALQCSRVGLGHGAVSRHGERVDALKVQNPDVPAQRHVVDNRRLRNQVIEEEVRDDVDGQALRPFQRILAVGEAKLRLLDLSRVVDLVITTEAHVDAEQATVLLVVVGHHRSVEARGGRGVHEQVNHVAHVAVGLAGAQDEVEAAEQVRQDKLSTLKVRNAVALSQLLKDTNHVSATATAAGRAGNVEVGAGGSRNLLQLVIGGERLVNQRLRVEGVVSHAVLEVHAILTVDFSLGDILVVGEVAVATLQESLTPLVIELALAGGCTRGAKPSRVIRVGVVGRRLVAEALSRVLVVRAANQPAGNGVGELVGIEERSGIEGAEDNLARCGRENRRADNLPHRLRKATGITLRLDVNILVSDEGANVERDTSGAGHVHAPVGFTARSAATHRPILVVDRPLAASQNEGADVNKAGSLVHVDALGPVHAVGHQEVEHTNLSRAARTNFKLVVGQRIHDAEVALRILEDVGDVVSRHNCCIADGNRAALFDVRPDSGGTLGEDIR